MSDVEGLDAEQTIEVVRRGVEACERSLGQPTERDLVKALVASLPDCVWCEVGDVCTPGTKGIPTSPLCDVCAEAWIGDITPPPKDLPYAPALRALLERMKAWDTPMSGAGARLVGEGSEAR